MKRCCLLRSTTLILVVTYITFKLGFVFVRRIVTQKPCEMKMGFNKSTKFNSPLFVTRNKFSVGLIFDNIYTPCTISTNFPIQRKLLATFTKLQKF